MVTQVSTTRGDSPWQPPVWLAPLSARLLAVATAMFWFVSSWLLIGRLTGSLRPLEPLVLLLVGLLVSGTILAGREVVARVRPAIARKRLFGWWILTSVGLVCFGWALSITGTQMIALGGFWTILAVQEVAAWRRWAVVHGVLAAAEPRFAEADRVDVTPPTEAASVERSSAPELSLVEQQLISRIELAADADEPTDWEEDEQLLAAGVSQQLTRGRTDQGSETVSGLLRAELAAGERNCSLHVAFCPALEYEPSVEVMTVAGAAARVKAADVQLFGVRFDVRLVEFSRQTQEVVLQFEARPPEPATMPTHPTSPSAGGDRGR